MRRKKLLTATVLAALTVGALTGPAAGAAPRAAYTEPVSVTPEGKAGNGITRTAVISRNGRHLALTADAEDLDPQVAHAGMYLRDPHTGKLRFAGFGGWWRS